MSTANPIEPLLPRPVSIRRIYPETRGIFTLALDVANGDAGLPFAPGQFNMLYVFGVGEVPISISSDPHRTGEHLHTIQAVGTVTQALARCQPGDVLGLRGPYGTSWPVAEAEGGDLLMIAGGIGLAPLRPLVHHVARHRSSFRRVTLLCGARSPDRLLSPYGPVIEEALPDIDVRETVDHAPPDWTGEVGVVPKLVSEIELEPEKTTAMICGPEVMLRFTVRELFQRMVPATSIYVSLERNMHCATGTCGHCQLGPFLLCRDGAVLRYDRVEPYFHVREL